MKEKNIFEAIRMDHDIQRNLCDTIVETSGDSKIRSRAWKALKHELKIHADAEERYFYVPLIEIDKTQDHARHGVAEYHEIDELIAKIEDAEMDSPAWLVYAKQLRDKVYHHLKDEEHTFFQLAGKVLSDGQKTGLQKDYRKHMSGEDAGVKA